MIPYSPEHTGDTLLDRIQATVRALLTALDLIPFLRGRAITGIVFAAGTARTVRHGLGRPMRGYFVTRVYGTNVANGVGESGAVAADPQNEIVLITTLAGTRDFWFY